MSPATNVFSKIAFGILSTALIGAIVKLLGLDVMVFALLDTAITSEKFTSIALALTGCFGLLLWTCFLVFRWDEKLYQLRSRRYSRPKVESLREAVRTVMVTLTSMSQMTLDPERKIELLIEQEKVMSELRAAAGDFLLERDFGRQLFEIIDCAVALGHICIRHDGKNNEAESFIQGSHALTSKVLDFLERTKHFAIFEP